MVSGRVQIHEGLVAAGTAEGPIRDHRPLVLNSTDFLRVKSVPQLPGAGFKYYEGVVVTDGAANLGCSRHGLECACFTLHLQTDLPAQARACGLVLHAHALHGECSWVCVRTLGHVAWSMAHVWGCLFKRLSRRTAFALHDNCMA